MLRDVVSADSADTRRRCQLSAPQQPYGKSHARQVTHTHTNPSLDIRHPVTCTDPHTL